MSHDCISSDLLLLIFPNIPSSCQSQSYAICDSCECKEHVSLVTQQRSVAHLFYRSVLIARIFSLDSFIAIVGALRAPFIVTQPISGPLSPPQSRFLASAGDYSLTFGNYYLCMCVCVYFQMNVCTCVSAYIHIGLHNHALPVLDVNRAERTAVDRSEKRKTEPAYRDKSQVFLCYPCHFKLFLTSNKQRPLF